MLYKSTQAINMAAHCWCWPGPYPGGSLAGFSAVKISLFPPFSGCNFCEGAVFDPYYGKIRGSTQVVWKLYLLSSYSINNIGAIMNILWLYNIPVLFYLFCWSDGSRYDQCEFFQSTVWPFFVSPLLGGLIYLFAYFELSHLLVLQNTPGSFHLFSVLALEEFAYSGMVL